MISGPLPLGRASCMIPRIFLAVYKDGILTSTVGGGGCFSLAIIVRSSFPTDPNHKILAGVQDLKIISKVPYSLMQSLLCQPFGLGIGECLLFCLLSRKDFCKEEQEKDITTWSSSTLPISIDILINVLLWSMTILQPIKNPKAYCQIMSSRDEPNCPGFSWIIKAGFLGTSKKFGFQT